MRRLPVVLAACLLGTSALAGGLGEMTEAERAAFREEVKAYLLENPEVLVEAMNVLQGREDQAAANRDLEMLAANKDAIFNDAASYVGGNPEGDITVVEFVDYRCGYCRKAHDEVAELVKSDGNIRFVLKEFPILGEDSVISSQFAISVLQLHGAEPYKQVHDALITLRGSPDEATLTRLAGDLGLDPAPLFERMKSPEVQAVIEANHALATTMEISGTPTFVVDQTMVRGYVPLDGMRQIVAGQRG
ncbi:DsbA family protein [Tabrizicola oligotrophica]|uniref:DsbA family protein n=1 Tax=Tabrizicola oligotrophica TaxID=2710650 RepID=A0A6M0QNG4_9RHOB|nr:DsbA family protein [Tabrizicola oligotrophica]NEY88927.1 DsbA family protein [Tabrizicola oligotrophica]